MATKDLILTLLKDGPKTTDQLIATIGKSYASVHTSLRRLCRAGKVFESATDGSWSLPGVPKAVAPTPPPLPKVATYKEAVKVTPPARLKRLKAILVVDNSGSVNSYAREMNNSINKTISDLKASAYRDGLAIDFSLYYFSYGVSNAIFNVDVRDVKPQPQQRPDGGTALFDGVERAINDHLRPERSDEDVSYLLTIITDGGDNQSGDRSGNRMKDLIRRVQSTDRWTIAFEMAPRTKDWFCRTYGIYPGNCVEWELTGHGVEQTTVRRTAAVQNYTASVSKGVRSTETFYTDMSNVHVDSLKKALSNIQDKVKTFQVPAEVEIRPFTEAQTGQPYQAGSIFYQLTKPELIQDTKKLLIKEKGGRAIYAGQDARTMLGLPQGVDCRVRPGNHGNFDLFVESTSVNRKLVRGTTVIHWPLSLQ